jgi:hypothetical protein
MDAKQEQEGRISENQRRLVYPKYITKCEARNCLPQIVVTGHSC